MLDGFPIRFDGPIPAFTHEGFLPPGDFLPLRIEFESRFVNVGNIVRRNSIYEGWNRHREALMHAGIPRSGRQLLDGGYTTAKESPGDIDIAVEVPLPNSDELASMPPDHPIVNLLQGPLTKPAYDCDAYPIYSLPKTDPLYAAVTVEAIRYWTKWFGRNRSGVPKGRVWATTGGLT